ncbi:MAG: tRNA (adenosine(37)-N6)-threonylcarbamoyltransferase complex ATPase subunit type 1 TsaE [Candidatus Obscuribacterales bacterium]|nr:tRNA (adenosine(37)-N6)-threonylcarbamoyltransferase complex ATPase subunit type 1 TsaE [Candidatus Obscuribacterales bacterium]
MSIENQEVGESLQIVVRTREETASLGRDLALAFESGAIVALRGNLGAGKTTLVQAVGKALGIKEVIASPTFTMMNEYHSGRLPVYHFDFYRVMEMCEREGELSLDLIASEFDEISESRRALVFIEWPQYFLVDGSNYLNGIDHLEIQLRPDNSEKADEECRFVTMSAVGATSIQLLNDICRARKF